MVASSKWTLRHDTHLQLPLRDPLELDVTVGVGSSQTDDSYLSILIQEDMSNAYADGITFGWHAKRRLAIDLLKEMINE